MIWRKHFFRIPARPGSCALVAGGLMLFGASQAGAARVTVDFEGEVVTVNGTPFDRTVPIGTRVRGYFAYETTTPDTLTGVSTIGIYPHMGTSEFCAEFLDIRVAGSGSAVGETNLAGAPTFRFIDGSAHPFAGNMFVNEVESPEAGFIFAISGTMEDLPTEAMPDPFRFSGLATTLSLSDANGLEGILMKTRRLGEFRPVIESVEKIGQVVTIEFRSVKLRDFEVWFSPDLNAWTRIEGALASEGLTTGWQDDLAQRFAGMAIPAAGYYIVREAPP